MNSRGHHPTSISAIGGTLGGKATSVPARDLSSVRTSRSFGLLCAALMICAVNTVNALGAKELSSPASSTSASSAPSTAPTAAPTPASEILVGEFASLSGATAAYGVNSDRGVHLAAELANQQGGVLGRKIHVVVEDDQSKAGQPAAAVKKLISNDHVVAVIGEFSSSLSLEAAPICQAEKIPMVSPGTTAPSFTDKGDYIFRVCYIDPFQGYVMAKLALSTLHAKSAAILVAVNQDYSVGLAKFFREYFTGHGGTIVNEMSYSSGDKEFRPQLTAIKAENPDVIFAPGYYAEGGLIAHQARSLGIKSILLSGDGWDSPRTIELGGSAIEGAYFSTHFSPDSDAPQVVNFVSAYRAKYGETPDTTAALGFDAMGVILDAIKRAGTTDGPLLRDALAHTKDYHGATGNISFDEHRNVVKPAVVLQIRDKTFHYVETVSHQ